MTWRAMTGRPYASLNLGPRPAPGLRYPGPDPGPGPILAARGGQQCEQLRQSCGAGLTLVHFFSSTAAHFVVYAGRRQSVSDMNGSG